jgi:hypothetical protein
VHIGEDAVGDADDAAVLGREQGLESLRLRPGDGHPARIEIHRHYS